MASTQAIKSRSAITQIVCLAVPPSQRSGSPPDADVVSVRALALEGISTLLHGIPCVELLANSDYTLVYLKFNSLDEAYLAWSRLQGGQLPGVDGRCSAWFSRGAPLNGVTLLTAALEDDPKAQPDDVFASTAGTQRGASWALLTNGISALIAAAIAWKLTSR